MSFESTFHAEHLGTGLPKIVKTCEYCGCNFLIPVPLSAKLAQKYCSECKPILAKHGLPLPDYSHLKDPYHPNETLMSEVNREYGTDLTRRQKLQLAWTQSFSRELNTLERKQREMKIRMGGRYK